MIELITLVIIIILIFITRGPVPNTPNPSMNDYIERFTSPVTDAQPTRITSDYVRTALHVTQPPPLVHFGQPIEPAPPPPPPPAPELAQVVPVPTPSAPPPLTPAPIKQRRRVSFAPKIAVRTYNIHDGEIISQYIRGI